MCYAPITNQPSCPTTPTQLESPPLSEGNITTRKVTAGVLAVLGITAGAVARYGAWPVTKFCTLGIMGGIVSARIYSVLKNTLFAPTDDGGISFTSGVAIQEAAPSQPIYIHKSFLPGQPIGIRDRFNNFCWVNALLQFGYHLPTLLRIIEQDPRFPQFQLFYKAYAKAEKLQERVVAEMDSRKVHSELGQLNPFLADPDVQQDVHEALMTILSKSSLGVLHAARFSDVREEGYNVFTISPIDHQNLPLGDLLARDMCSTEEVRFFDRVPDELFFCIARFYQSPDGLVKKYDEHLKLEPRITVPVAITIDVDRPNRQYACDAFIEHQGDSLDEGHYVTYVKREGLWWLCDGELITRVFEIDAVAAMRNAYILHYSIPKP